MRRVFVALVLLASAAAVIANVPGGTTPPTIEVQVVVKAGDPKDQIRLTATINPNKNTMNSVIFYAIPEVGGPLLASATQALAADAVSSTFVFKKVPFGSYTCYAELTYNKNTTLASNDATASIAVPNLPDFSAGTLEWNGKPTVNGTTVNGKVTYKKPNGTNWQPTGPAVFHLKPKRGPIVRSLGDGAGTTWTGEFTNVQNGKYRIYALVEVKQGDSKVKIASITKDVAVGQ